MSATVTATPSSGTFPTSTFRIDVLGAPANTTTGYDATKYPSEPEVRYYLSFEKSSVAYGRSYVFAPSPSDGSHTFNNYTFPSTGSWSVVLRKSSDDSSVATASVTIS